MSAIFRTGVSGRSSNLHQARKYLAATPGAVAGAGGHDRTFGVACKLVEFGLPPAEVWGLLIEFNSRCLPPWSDRDLRHKLQDAFRLARPQQPFQAHSFPFRQRSLSAPVPSIDPATAVENFLAGVRSDEAEIWEASPIRPPNDWKDDALALLDFMFEPGELINFVTAHTTAAEKDGTVKARPQGFGQTLERDALLTRWRKGGVPYSEAGAWLRMNPMDGKGVSDANVTAFRFALIECDGVPLDLQLSLLAKLPLPIAAILSSGGRSLHAWIKVDADNFADYRHTVGRMLALLAKFGVDGKNKNPSRMSRLPGVVRRIGATGDGRQRLLYLNSQPEQRSVLA